MNHAIRLLVSGMVLIVTLPVVLVQTNYSTQAVRANKMIGQGLERRLWRRACDWYGLIV
jgi:hypothetical protein